MKFNIFAFAAAFAAIVALPACDNVDEQDRYIEVERPHSEKVVLIEKFTGLGCINCPAGDEVIHTLLNTYQGNVIAVSMHPSPGIPAFNKKYGQFDLRTPEAQPYFEKYSVSEMPYAVIDGKAFDGSSNPPQWSAYVQQQLALTPPVSIAVTNEYDPASRNVDIYYKVYFADPVPAACSVLCWVIENDIVGPQLTPTAGVMADYQHNHIFRATANGTWGTRITAGATSAGESVEGSASISLNDAWVADKCQIVVFVFDSASLAVHQAAVADVVPAFL